MTKKEWQLLSKKPLYKNDWIDIEQWKIQVGKEYVGEYSIELANDVVVIFPITADKQVVLLSQYYIAHLDYAYSLPAGIVDEGDHLATAHNELREETGYATDNMIYLGSSFLAKYKTGRVHYYCAKDVYKVGDQQLGPSEDIETMLVPMVEFRSLLSACKVQDLAQVACSYLALDHLDLLSS